ncbi:hypothetical protein GUJ93_ZPchr0012g19369 [Zizania palustris]|uniref:Uncharacterized protein n=1 Tax=Zizania palustris TaxID=103762 RepID=A0A8J5WQ93_ZIZPA|nr:hypothetical protein GUJ93_ZPchr0012g19369 [Zizania palustris]
MVSAEEFHGACSRVGAYGEFVIRRGQNHRAVVASVVHAASPLQQAQGGIGSCRCIGIRQATLGYAVSALGRIVRELHLSRGDRFTVLASSVFE